PDWMKAAAAEPARPVPAGTRGVILLDERTVSVTSAGQVRSVTRRVARITATPGRELAIVGVPFDNEMKLVRLRGWSIGPDGQEYQVAERDATEMSAYDGELYADDRMKVLRLPSSEPGSVVGYEFEHVERPYGMQDLWYFQSDLPVRRARYTLALPQGWTYDARWIHRDAATPRESAGTFVWELTDVPAIEKEPAAPALSALSGRMGVTFLPPSNTTAHRTWSDVARWYEMLATPRGAVTPAIDAKAKALSGTAESRYEKIAALARFAQRDVRYVAIEIGIGSYQPHAADAVLSTLYGDCKDKVTLLASMLRAIGIESRAVLVNSNRGVVDDRFPSRLGFNHVIIAIPLPGDAPKNLPAVKDGFLYFDPTTETIPLGLLPVYLQGNRGLLVSGDARALIELPLQSPQTSRLARSAKLTLAADGTLTGTFDEVRTGEIAASYRNALASLNNDERRNFVASALAFNLDDHALNDLVFENLDDASQDLRVTYRVTAQKYARNAGGMLLVRPRVIGRKAESIVDLAERKHDYLTDGPSQQTDDIEIVVPAGLIADELPPARKVSTPVVTYSSESTFAGGALRYKRSYEVHRVQVARDELATLNKAFAEILADERATALLK
ncbi:MAG TPA: DUF3857 and transglutaminase domain-containing protein, partial [Thermoanaerobaculia bacterium]